MEFKEQVGWAQKKTTHEGFRKPPQLLPCGQATLSVGPACCGSPTPYLQAATLGHSATVPLFSCFLLRVPFHSSQKDCFPILLFLPNPILSSQSWFKCHHLRNFSWLDARTPSLLFALPPLWDGRDCCYIPSSWVCLLYHSVGSLNAGTSFTPTPPQCGHTVST